MSTEAGEGTQAGGILPEQVELRQVKYLNNIVEQDHRFMCAVSAFVRSLSEEGEVESKASRTTAYLAAKAKGNKSMHVKRGDVSELRMQEPTWLLLKILVPTWVCYATSTRAFKASNR